MSDPIRPSRSSPRPTATDWGLRTPKREEPLAPRAVYQNAIARDYAERGHSKFAELVELGHGCAACHLTRASNGPPHDGELDLDRYARVTAGVRGARTAVELFQTAFMGALASFQSRAVTAASRIRVEGLGEGARDAITLRQIGEQLTSDPVARRAYAQVQRQGTLVVLDFKSRPAGLLGEANWLENQLVVYVAKHLNAKSAVGTLVHESSHIQRFARGHTNDLYDEFRAHAREFLYEHGRRPNLADRNLLWRYVRKHYPDLE